MLEQSNYPLQMPNALQQLLQQRGISTVEAVQDFLYPKLQNLKDPYSLKNMGPAVDRLLLAYRKHEKICIYADFDLDGTSGLALLKNGLDQLGYQGVIYYQPKRLSEGYGFHASAVEDLKKQNVNLIVTVDVGITAHAACLKAKDFGIDVIVTDHHLPATTLPEALWVINPNQQTCTSGLGYLSGAGVAFYLLRALKREFEKLPDSVFLSGKPDLDLKSLLEYFTIATLTDMVPLIQDNRTLVKLGLLLLTKTTKPGLKALMQSLDLWGRELTAADVAIKLAPKLNALSRLENGLLPVDLFLMNDLVKAQSLVQQVLDNNNNRVELQNQAEREALQLLKSWNIPDFIFVSSSQFHRGVVGLVATKLSQAFQRPAFVGSLSGDGMIVGSARTPSENKTCLVEALNAGSHLLQRFGGHSAAAGFEISAENVSEFIKSLQDYFMNKQLQSDTFKKTTFDIKVSLANIDDTWMKWHDFLGPFGVGFTIPIFLFESIQVVQVKELKGGHCRLTLESGHEALCFSPNEATKNKLLSIAGQKLSFTGTVQWNYFAGRKKVQILIQQCCEEYL